MDMLKLGAEYHEIGYHTYLQWILERVLQEEAAYYGWGAIGKDYTIDHSLIPSNLDKKDVQRLTRLAMRKAREQQP